MFGDINKKHICKRDFRVNFCEFQLTCTVVILGGRSGGQVL